MSTIYLDEHDVERLLDIPTAIEVIEESFRQLAAGQAENVPRARAAAPGIVLHMMSASCAYLGRLGWKSYVTTRDRARFLVGLYEQATGELLALIEANRLGQMRTGAATAVAVRSLAWPEAGELGLFGAGWQAEAQLAAIAAVRPIRRGFVYSRDADRRLRFAEQMAARLDLEVVAVDRPQAAVDDLPLVVTATTSREPVFDGARIREGALICAIGSNGWNRAELDSLTIARADNVVCDSVAACQREAGDFRDALERGMFDWSRAVDLSEVVAGRAIGRSCRESVVVFKSVGLAVEDVALASELLDRARKVGAGRVLPI